MRVAFRRELGCVLALSLFGSVLMPALGSAAVQPAFDLRSTTTAPFPTNRFTVTDQKNLTSRRINLPKPNCSVRPVDCNDINVLNSLDGFNLQPRLSIPFSDPIDPTTVNSSNVFLIRLGDVAQTDTRPAQVIGINQLVWDRDSKTLFAESDEFLEQHTQYLLVVTDGIRDEAGAALVRSSDFQTFLNDPTNYRFADSTTAAYRSTLLDALRRCGVPTSRMLAASVFTTQSITAELEKIRDRIKGSVPSPAGFVLFNGTRTVYPYSTVKKFEAKRQRKTTSELVDVPLTTPLELLGVVPNAIGTLAFGAYTSVNYQNAQRYIPPTGTSTGSPVLQRRPEVIFTLILPAGRKPTAGWPVAIFGTGSGEDKETIFGSAAVMASKGIATIAINIVGHGGGELGDLVVTRTTGSLSRMPAGGRGIDTNGDGMIGPFEGAESAAPYTLISLRDGMRQTVIDLMQLTRVIQTDGMDVNGDGVSDLDPNRIYYFGISLGGMYGTVLTAIEPSIRAAFANVTGSSLVETSRLGAARPIFVAPAVAARGLSNVMSMGAVTGFNENMPLRNEPVRINDVPGALAIQEFLDRWEWAGQSGDPIAYATHISKNPLRGNTARRLLLQFAKDDLSVPNPTTAALIRAGGFTNLTFFRTDLAAEAQRALGRGDPMLPPEPDFPANPHTYLARFDFYRLGFARAGQNQIATMFFSDGRSIVDPDGAGVLFESPFTGPLPEALTFLPAQ